MATEVFCSELDDSGERHALILDLSADGLRLQRPIGGPRTRTLQLEFEIPEVDEVAWAVGEICFDQVWQVRPVVPGTPSGILRTSGIRLVSSSSRHERLIRDYVTETWRLQQLREERAGFSEWLMRSFM